MIRFFSPSLLSEKSLNLSQSVFHKSACSPILDFSWARFLFFSSTYTIYHSKPQIQKVTCLSKNCLRRSFLFLSFSSSFLVFSCRHLSLNSWYRLFLISISKFLLAMSLTLSSDLFGLLVKFLGGFGVSTLRLGLGFYLTWSWGPWPSELLIALLA